MELDTAEDGWKKLRSAISEAAIEAVGFSKERHQDWFDENSPRINDLLKSQTISP